MVPLLDKFKHEVELILGKEREEKQRESQSMGSEGELPFFLFFFKSVVLALVILPFLLSEPLSESLPC